MPQRVIGMLQIIHIKNANYKVIKKLLAGIDLLYLLLIGLPVAKTRKTVGESNGVWYQEPA